MIEVAAEQKQLYDFLNKKEGPHTIEYVSAHPYAFAKICDEHGDIFWRVRTLMGGSLHDSDYPLSSFQFIRELMRLYGKDDSWIEND